MRWFGRRAKISAASWRASRNLAQELPAVRKADQDIQKLVLDLPGLAQDPAALNKRLAAVHNPFYFFALGSWQAALSTGALAHMPTEEVEQYGSAISPFAAIAIFKSRRLLPRNAL